MAESVGSRHWPLARSSVLGESSMWYPRNVFCQDWETGVRGKRPE